jgi:hypothetical protein
MFLHPYSQDLRGDPRLKHILLRQHGPLRSFVFGFSVLRAEKPNTAKNEAPRLASLSRGCRRQITLTA